MPPKNSRHVEPKRFAMIGAGFWAQFQLAAWQEVEGARCVAICDRSKSKAEALADRFGVPAVYDDAATLFDGESIDFVDIVTDVYTHAPLVQLAASRKIPAICQKPLATSLDEAKAMSEACQQAGVSLYVHENWRWQRPMRAVKEILEQGQIGTPYRARIEMVTGFPVFENQPGLAELEHLILADLGTHLLDVARMFFGEALSLYCQTQQVYPGIQGEDAATVMMSMNSGQTTVTCQMAYAGSILERECFPQTMMFVEGSHGSLELAPDYWIRTTTAEGTVSRRWPPQMYSWIDPAYAIAHSSIVDCHANLLSGFADAAVAPETTAEDNLKTLQLVFDAYDSARQGIAVHYPKPA